MKMQTLFVFAHQDDEYFAVPWIEVEIAQSHEVFCVYLTDGGSRTQPGVRDRESLHALERLGIDEAHIGFIAADRRAPDGQLYLFVSEAATALRKWLDASEVRPATVYAPDWE